MWKNQIPVHFLKCDVEGHELEVLMSGQKLLKMYHPVIIVESEARHCGKDNVIALFDLIKNNGYNGFFYNGESLVSIDKFDIEKYQLNNLKNICEQFFLLT